MAHRSPGRPTWLLGQKTLRREDVVSEALALVDASGLEALGIRPLAARLGIEPQSLYTHVKDKEQLLDAVAEKILDGVAPAYPPDATWEQRLRLLALELRRTLLEHRKAVALFATRSPIQRAWFAAADETFRRMREAGFQVPEAVAAFDAVVALALGDALREVGDTEGELASGWELVPVWEPRGLRRDEEVRDRYPDLWAVHTVAFARCRQSEFARSLEALLAGLRPPDKKRGAKSR